MARPRPFAEGSGLWFRVGRKVKHSRGSYVTERPPTDEKTADRLKREYSLGCLITVPSESFSTNIIWGTREIFGYRSMSMAVEKSHFSVIWLRNVCLSGRNEGWSRRLDRHNDTDIVGAVCRGQHETYAQLVRRHYDRVFLVCLGTVGNVHDAEDVAQETMIKGLEKIRQLRDPSQFGHWIVRIARNLAINHLRRRSRIERLPEPGCDEVVPREGTTADLHEAVARLPLDLRQPLVMFYFDGCSVKTVAQTLEISTSGVYAKLREALKQLHVILTTPGEMP